MSVFAQYSRYYDLLYKDKDYAGEVSFVNGLIKELAPAARTILELGCGTGIHAKLLAEAGYDIHGIDRSAEMLEGAQGRLAEVNPEVAGRLSFSQGDVRTVRVNGTFDVVISLFHVMSYQVTNEDILAALETARVHLKPGGLFIFDCWYGPAVLAQKPEVRIKRLEDEVIAVTRLAEPEIHVNDNIVDVNYHIMAIEKASNKFNELRETHHMRYLFRPEIEHYLSLKGMHIERSVEWMTGKGPGSDTWGVCFSARCQ